MSLVRIKTKQYEENLIGVMDFKEMWTKNENWSISFLLCKNELNEFDYHLLKNEETIIYENQSYSIKNTETLSEGKVSVKQVEATHIMFNIKDHVQDEVREGKLTYSIEEALNFGISGNQLGYTFEVVGNFEKVLIENLGDIDGLEMVRKVCERFGAVVIPNNKHLVFYSEDTWTTSTNKQFREGFNTFGMNISIDTTNLKTAVKGYGMKREESEEYYFQPITYYSPNLSEWNDGKAKWMKAIRDETINNPETMLTRLKKELQDYPEVSLSTNTIENAMLKKGEIWAYINAEQQINTEVTIVGYTKYPFDQSKNGEVTFSNARKTMTDIQLDIARAAKKAERELQNPSHFVNSQISGYIKEASKAVNDASKAVRFNELGISTNVPEFEKGIKRVNDEILIGDGAIWVDGKRAVNKQGIDASFLYNVDLIIPELPVYEVATTSKDGLMASEMVVKLNDLKKVATAWSNGLMSMKDKSKLDLINVTKQIDLDKLQQDVEKLKGVK